ncbi:uncharacterized protein V6R79_004382 [Siganus canaliculatus]
MATLDVHSNVKDYYSRQLQSTEDVQTSAPACARRPVTKSVREALDLVHPDVSKRFFGCGLPFPSKLAGCKVLDLGSGSGRDCYAFSKLVGENGYVTGVDMTESLVTLARQYLEYHQKTFGYKEPNVSFVQGYMEKLSESGIKSDSVDVVISNCVICLCPDKRVVMQEAYNALKEGGELYFSDMYSDKVIPDSMKQDPALWGEGLSGCLFWQDLISLARSVGFSTPQLVSSTIIVVQQDELHKKAAGFRYASVTYRMFKLPKNQVLRKATVTYKGTLADFPEKLDFDSSHSFKTGEAVEVDGEMAAVLQSSRFSADFQIQMAAEPESKSESTQYCHLDPFRLADKLESSQAHCSKKGK